MFFLATDHAGTRDAARAALGKAVVFVDAPIDSSQRGMRTALLDLWLLGRPLLPRCALSRPPAGPTAAAALPPAHCVAKQGTPTRSSPPPARPSGAARPPKGGLRAAREHRSGTAWHGGPARRLLTDSIVD